MLAIQPGANLRELFRRYGISAPCGYRIDEEIRAEQLPTLNQGLVERAAFRDIFEFAKTLDELTDSTTSGLERARVNAHAFAQEVVDALKAIQ